MYNNEDLASRVEYFLDNGDFCRVLINFVNHLAPDQDRQNVGHDLNPNRLNFFKKGKILKNSVDNNKSMTNDQTCKEVSLQCLFAAVRTILHKPSVLFVGQTQIMRRI